MKKTIPKTTLTRINWVLAMVMGGIVCLILMHENRIRDSIIYTVLTTFTIALIGYANIVIFLFLARKFEQNSSRFKMYRYLLTYSASALVYLVIWPASIYNFAERKWVYSDLLLMTTFILGSAMVNSIILILHNTILLHTQKIQADLEFSNLKAAHAEAANLLLKQQIHPHFLFNALNTVRVLYNNDLQAGDSYIVHLAGFLRASVFDHAAKISTLSQEVNILNDYLQMQKIRFGMALNCTVAIPEQNFPDFYLPSFSLQPLLENAIKHNELTEQSPLNVLVEQQGDRIIVSNNLQRKTIKMESTNSGLANLAERYRLWSGDEVIIQRDEKVFSVSIKLLTDEYSHHRR